jgi:hypothetical protein
MKRHLSMIMILCGFSFSHLAFAVEWQVERGDTIWKILTEACQVKPSMQKARVFARAVGIRAPGYIVIGERIDVSRGCAAISDVHASLAKVITMSAQQGETLRIAQSKIVALEVEVAKLRANFESSNWDGAVSKTPLYRSGEQYRTEVNAGMSQGFSSHMGVSMQQGAGVKEDHAFGDPGFFSRGWVVVAALSLFAGLSYLWKWRKRDGDGTAVPGDSDGDKRMSSPMELSGVVSPRAGVDNSGLQFLRTLEKGFITLSVPFTLAMYIRFYQRVPDMGIVSFWCAIPMYVEGRGYETFEYDAKGNCAYVETLDAFRWSVENSIRLFLDGKSDEEMGRRIMAALSYGLLRPSE